MLANFGLGLPHGILNVNMFSFRRSMVEVVSGVHFPKLASVPFALSDSQGR